MTNSSEKPYAVVCVCGGYGYPLGTATAARITMVGRALCDAGISFRLLHCGPSPVGINTRRRGVFEGISFEYMTSVRRPRSRFLRMLAHMRGVAGLTPRLIAIWPRKRSTAVYLYVMDSPLALYVGILCWLLRIPVVQEMCEWFPGDPSCSPFVHWLHRRVLFRFATGVLAISNAIEERVGRKSAEIGRALLVQKLPALVDATRFPANPPRSQAALDVPEFVYCGTWRKDLVHLVAAYAIVKRSGHPCRLRIIGARAAEQLGALLRAQAVANGLSEQELILSGCVDQLTLEDAYRSAAALLMPLWNDDRSITRLPNKMSEYLASGRPVISCPVGDVTEFLTDGVSAYLAAPEDPASFASKMISVLENPREADRIGAAGREVCLAVLDYRRHSQGLGQFFRTCIQNGGPLQA